MFNPQVKHCWTNPASTTWNQYIIRRLGSKQETSITEQMMSKHLELSITYHSSRCFECNTDRSRVHSEDWTTQTKPIMTPDEVPTTFSNNIQVILETLNSLTVMSRPVLTTPPEPTSQVGLLKSEIRDS